MSGKLTTTALVLCSILAAAGGYWIGFRQAWTMSQMTDASVRGAMAVHQLRMLEHGRIDDVKVSWESDVDFGLLLWPGIDNSPLRQSLNILSGQKVIPDYEQYVRTLATYRQNHASPLEESKVVSNMIASARKLDPDFAEALTKNRAEKNAAIESVIKKYAN